MGKTGYHYAREEDLALVVSMMRQFYREEGYPFFESAAEQAARLLLANPMFGRFCFLTFDGEIAGYLVVTFGFSLEFLGKDAFVDELFVLPAFRGQGIGTQALQFAEVVCKEAGVRALHLEVEFEKNRTHLLYERVGFKDHTRHLMTKWLVPRENAEDAAQ